MDDARSAELGGLCDSQYSTQSAFDAGGAQDCFEADAR